MSAICPQCGFENPPLTTFCHDCLASLDLNLPSYCDEHLQALRAACEAACGGTLPPVRFLAVVGQHRTRVLEVLADLEETDAAEGTSADVAALDGMKAQLATYLDGLAQLERFSDTGDPLWLEQGLTQIEQVNHTLNDSLAG